MIRLARNSAVVLGGYQRPVQVTFDARRYLTQIQRTWRFAEFDLRRIGQVGQGDLGTFAHVCSKFDERVFVEQRDFGLHTHR